MVTPEGDPSPSVYVPEVAPPDYVQIFDTTLRDGEQSPGIALNEGQKLQIAHQLARLGVDIIEAGFPMNSLQEFLAVQAIGQQVEGPVIAGLARVNKSDVDRAAEALRDAERPRIHTFIATSDIHITHKLKSTRKDVLGQARAGVAYAKSHVDDVQFSAEDATRSDVDFLAEVFQAAIDEGATTINIPDTVGYTTPDEYKALIGQLYKLVPDLGKVVVSVHCHNDLGLAVSNSAAGLEVGARQVEGTINGIGERAGNAALEEIIMLLKTRGDRYDLRTGIRTREIGQTSRMVERLTDYPVSPNKPIIGRNAFTTEAGIHQHGVIENRATYEIMDPGQVGMDPDRLSLGKHSGKHAVLEILKEQGVVDTLYLKRTVALFQEVAAAIKIVSGEQLLALHDEAERRETGRYSFTDYSLEKNGNDFWAEVNVIEKGKPIATAEASNNSEYPGVDGPISALFQAMKSATDTNYEFAGYSFDAIGDTETTIGEAIVKLRHAGKVFTGKGLSMDTLEAAGLAYLNALSQIG